MRSFPTSKRIRPASPLPSAGRSKDQYHRAAQASAVGSALGNMADIVCELGDELANQRPALSAANSPYAILSHCLGVVEFWLGHVLRGRPTTRDRDREFASSGPVERLLIRVRISQMEVSTDFCRPFPRTVRHPEDHRRASPAEIVTHVLRELHQHLGHLEMTRDILQSRESALDTAGIKRLGSRARVASEVNTTPSWVQSPQAMSGTVDVLTAARHLMDSYLLRLDELWLGFWAEGGDANILELDAYLHNEMKLSAEDANRLRAVVGRLVADSSNSE